MEEKKRKEREIHLLRESCSRVCNRVAEGGDAARVHRTIASNYVEWPVSGPTRSSLSAVFATYSSWSSLSMVDDGVVAVVAR